MQIDPQEEQSKNTAQAARILGVTPAAMVRWRFEHRGPAYIKFARNLVRYRVSDLLLYMDAHRVAGKGPQ